MPERVYVYMLRVEAEKESERATLETTSRKKWGKKRGTGEG